MSRALVLGATVTVLGLLTQPVGAQRLGGEQLIRALQDGGYVLVMRHAPAAIPTAPPPGAGGRGGFGGGRGGRGGPPADAGPPQEELTNDSINMLIGTRHAFWHFKIPVAAIYASPTRRTMQQAGEVPFAAITSVDELSLDNAASGWLAAKLKEPPMAHENTIIVTHSTNIANDLNMPNVAEGETLVVRPGPNPTVVGRIGLREWSELAVTLDP
jgi:hypothetical protein